jgi:integrase
MKSRPKGVKYRNLTARSGVIYYQRCLGGRRIRFSCNTDDWTKAAAVRDLYEQRSGVGRAGFASEEAPRFSAFATRYLAEDTDHLATTTGRDRRSHLRVGGPLDTFLGSRRLDEITPAVLREWWSSEIESQGRSRKTGREYVNSLAALFGYARDLDVVATSPVADFRDMLRRRSRTKQGRAANQADVNPITDPAELERLVDAASKQDERSHLLVLLMLDAGVRLGEATAVTWGQVVWGADGDDTGRTLVIDRNRPRGGATEGTKSGRSRRIPLSRRLRGALLKRYLKEGRPSPETAVLGRIDPNNFRKRAWARICERARIGHRKPKDLRDTFGSWLVSLGAPLPFVQDALGHASWDVTAKHYAQWVPAAGAQPVQLEAGDVWPDRLALLRNVGKSDEVAASPLVTRRRSPS